MLGAHVLVAEPSCFLARLSEHVAQTVGELESVQERVTLVLRVEVPAEQPMESIGPPQVGRNALGSRVDVDVRFHLGLAVLVSWPRQLFRVFKSRR